MGSEGEFDRLDMDGNENTIFVAVSKNLKQGKSLLLWAVKSFPGKNLCILHVHHSTHLLSLMDEKLSASKLKQQAIKACRDLERQKMQKLLNQYRDFLSEMGIKADKMWIEMNNIGEGILQLIVQHRITRLVMGAAAATAAEKLYTKNLSDIKSNKAIFVCQKAPVSCHIWFICKGSLIYARLVNCCSSTATTAPLSSTNKGETKLTSDCKENADDDAEDIQFFDHPRRSFGKMDSTLDSSSMPTLDEARGDSLPLCSQDMPTEHLPHSPPISLPEVIPDDRTCKKETLSTQNNLEHGMMDAKKSRQAALKESVMRLKAEEDAWEAVHKAEESENLLMEEISRRKEMEEALARQNREIEMIKHRKDQSLKELHMIQNKKPTLESQLREAYSTERELEEKIIQAVNLLITFRGKRDILQVERDTAIREANKLRLLAKEDPTCMNSPHFFELSFSDIIEVTHNFDPSQKIGEGRSGSVYKGMLCHMKVAIKMLPSSGSQSDSEFKHEVEDLCRVRHPNLVTVVGACCESRSLVYEYMENGSLADHLGCQGKLHPLPWQYRIRIASEICSALIFLHDNNRYMVHGNLKPSNVLLDNNFLSKVSDLGIYNLISHNDVPLARCSLYDNNDGGSSVYGDPEVFGHGEVTTGSDVYSFGIILLELLTARPPSTLVKDVKCALENGQLDKILDSSAGDWPLVQAKQLAHLALWCCQKKRLDRPSLIPDVWAVLDALKDLSAFSSSVPTSSPLENSRRKIPSHFVCPIFQEVMKDPHVAADGFTYEADAIQAWFSSGHKTSPMTNMKLENCDLLPNYALYYAIQDWQQIS